MWEPVEAAIRQQIGEATHSAEIAEAVVRATLADPRVREAIDNVNRIQRRGRRVTIHGVP